MAERRMIHRKASVSTDLAELHEKHGGDALAFYLLMIPHFDRWGCVPDSPAKLRAMVVPMLSSITAAEVKRWTAWMVKRGMLEKVAAQDGDQGLRSPDFHEHQRGTEFQKEAPSPWEPPNITKQWTRTARKPNSADLQDGRRPVVDQSASGRRVVGAKGKEGKGSETSPSFPPDPLPERDQSRPLEGPTDRSDEEGANGEVKGKDLQRVDWEAIKASVSPPIAAAIERGRRKAADA